ncbi:hypothetical protein BCR34DRAFT_475304 [Clohesyomyces aquaticus]|uniref:Transglutaminase-like domain-containing protein n=1 Tax=Clohesyomyces aquaticus TaxID=1231657 RepID=A0A1Y2A488_9PLEO|nr:hypothetical protein BCR34DRAFT_475304 [Clohesyomyces aquaticus]
MCVPKRASQLPSSSRPDSSVDVSVTADRSKGKEARHSDESRLGANTAEELTLRFRELLSQKRMDTLSDQRGSQRARTQPTESASTPARVSPSSTRSSLRNLPIVPTAPHNAQSLRFKNMLMNYSNVPLNWENPGLLDEALAVVPLQRIYDEAEEESLILQAEAESLGPGMKAAWGYQDCVIRALVRWFKRSFFSWVHNPRCSRCYSPTVGMGMATPIPDEQAGGAHQVELYRCTHEGCASYERFPRYTDPFVLLQTRRGRVGEWANCFGLLCRGVGSRVRWVWNSEDHVWVEIYSVHRKRWVHVDPCEEAWDKPRLYTEGWGKKLGYCIAFSADGATDVTRRYVRCSSQAGERLRCSESELLHIMHEINTLRRGVKDKREKFRLEGEDARENKELRCYVIAGIVANLMKLSPGDKEQGRTGILPADEDKVRVDTASAQNAMWRSTR